MYVCRALILCELSLFCIIRFGHFYLLFVVSLPLPVSDSNAPVRSRSLVNFLSCNYPPRCASNQTWQQAVRIHEGKQPCSLRDNHGYSKMEPLKSRVQRSLLLGDCNPLCLDISWQAVKHHLRMSTTATNRTISQKTGKEEAEGLLRAPENLGQGSYQVKAGSDWQGGGGGERERK